MFLETLKSSVQVSALRSQKVPVYKGVIYRLWRFRRSKLDQNILIKFMHNISAIGYKHYFPTEKHVLDRTLNNYFPNSWGLAKRLDAIYQHYQLLKTLPSFLDVTKSYSNVVMNLGEQEAVLICGSPKWPSNQGEVALHLVKNEKTLMVAPFTLGLHNNELVIYLWAIQQESADSSSLLPTYRDFGGMRTQDLMIEMLRLLAKKIKAKKILAISDEARGQCYTRLSHSEKMWLRFRFNSVWISNGSVELETDFFEIPIEHNFKAIDVIPVGKRNLISKRYSILKKITEAYENTKYLIGLALSVQLLFQLMCGLRFFYTAYESFNVLV